MGSPEGGRFGGWERPLLLFDPLPLAGVCTMDAPFWGFTTRLQPQISQLELQPRCHCHSTEPCVSSGLESRRSCGRRQPVPAILPLLFFLLPWGHQFLLLCPCPLLSQGYGHRTCLCASFSFQ